ncbi:4-hydroxythreonine-4-phosphate dehydrogenase [Oceanicola granulosus HTCC2516]|uniref:4-hydroxythreonine-4-phosphate dehydrogenase n=1 Tax=Oceanicola granulosus (strain ATCC BAA-861 / DSM 15982 / KCTC 12143 / HTCC2516) TaxID=314256 RepID=Q2CC12_OCEGH|nr:4-hydroxythreonine-4-phosphate dehydrogenase PdxA [Oceanicola granulosus]EAR50182.1 4-hydroxythreonine-4-phosphate dehydrogenase [Oceanicola granulosus HTCC2516]
MTVALTCGEPAGIGPEIAVAAWAALRGELGLLYIGDPAHLPEGTPWEATDPAGAPEVMARALPVLARDFGAPRTPGRPDPTHAAHVVDAIAEAVALVSSGACSALCTAPIHKQALIDGAAFAYPGHTEFLAALAGGGRRAVMMLACPELRVVPATIHIPLADVPAALTAELLEETIRTTRDALVRDFGIDAPRLAVAGLNPHAGEGGKMGREEIETIAPLLERLRGEGFDLAGPLSADTMFHPPARARYDAAICAYHDQALIPIKTVDFASGVNVTLGLPFVRTSPDHGTAFDLAGTGRADATSLIAALRMAHELGARRAAVG